MVHQIAIYPHFHFVAQAFDAQIASDANNYPPDYFDLLSLTLRQAMSPFDITVSANSDGSFNTSDVLVFVKNLGNVGGPG